MAIEQTLMGTMKSIGRLTQGLGITDMRGSRVSRDTEDLEKLKNWFSQHNPFAEINEIMSISTELLEISVSIVTNL